MEKEVYNSMLTVNEKSEYSTNFVSLGFWVDNNELEEILQKHETIVHNIHHLRVVLRMTDACNFRCPYCYQKHETVSLSDDKIQIIKKFLSDKYDSADNIEIHYFGGEPLLNYQGILDIDEFIQKNKGRYNGTITTNGYLLNKEVILLLKGTCIESYQITLDGPPDIHNKSRVLANGNGTFYKLLENIKLLLTLTEAKLVIRMNLGKRNKDSVSELLEVLSKEEILNNTRVTVFFPQLHDYTSSNDNETYYEKNEYFHALLDIMKLLLKYNKKVPKYGPRNIACSMYKENTFIIGPDLGLEACTVQERKIGRLNKFGKAIYNQSLKEKELYYDIDEKCKKCILLPMCMGGCPFKRSIKQNTCLMDLDDLRSYIDLLIMEQEKSEV